MTQSIVYLRIMRRAIFLCIFILLTTFSGFPQGTESPYELTKKDYGIVGSAILLNSAAFFIRNGIENPTLTDLNSLERADINRLDRTATYNWSPSASDWSDRTEIASIAFPLILLAPQKSRKDAVKLFVMGAEAVAVNQGLTDLTKSITRRYRPFTYNEEVPIDTRLAKNARLSFYSGHTSASATFCFFTATVFEEYFPDSAYKPLVWATAITLPAITGWLRYEAGKHYLSDVIIAYGMGALVGTFIPKIHLKTNSSRIVASGNSSGLNISYRF